MADPQSPPARTLRDLFPSLSEDEARLAEEEIDRYLALAAEVYQALRADPARYADFRRRLTEVKESSTLTGEDNSTDVK
jgi:hypothetical protein